MHMISLFQQAAAVAMQAALQSIQHDIIMQNNSKNNNGVTSSHGMTKSFIDGLLCEEEEEPVIIDYNCHQHHHLDLLEQKTICNNASTVPQLYEVMRGLPQRPFYRELSRRLMCINKYTHQTSSESQSSANELMQSSAAIPNIFLPASHFGMTELQCMNSLIPQPPSQHDITSVEACKEWVLNSGESGIMATLGMRRTMGTVSKCFEDRGDRSSYLFPPPISQLLVSSRRLHKPTTRSSLTVAARALAKHAHRGSRGFYGDVKGSESNKNLHADLVV